MGEGGGEIQNIVKKNSKSRNVGHSAYNVHNAVLIQVTMEILLACVR